MRTQGETNLFLQMLDKEIEKLLLQDIKWTFRRLFSKEIFYINLLTLFRGLEIIYCQIKVKQSVLSR